MHPETDRVEVEKAVVTPQQPPPADLLAEGKPASFAHPVSRVYGATIVSVILMTLVRLAISPLLGIYHTPFPTYLLAVVFSAWIGGWRAGLLATALSALIASCLFVSYPLSFDLSASNDLFRLMSFLIISGAIIAINETLGRAKRSAETRTEELEHEIDRRQRAEAASRHERELLQTIIDRIPVMITLYEPDTKVLRLNPEFERVVGWSAHETAGASLMERCYPDPAYRAEVLRFMESCREGWMDIRMRARDGRDIETSWANIRLSNQTQIGIGIDISARKAAEAALQHNFDALQQAHAEIEDLNVRLRRAISESHHRIKNNLQVLSAIMDIQMAAGPETLPLSALQRLQQQVRSLAVLHDLLTLESKAGSALDTVPARAMMDRLLPLWQSVMGERRLVAQIAEARLTMKQASAFILLVNELLSNAVKHGKGDVAVNLAVDASRSQAGDLVEGQNIARLEVGDDGPGFPADFDPKQAASTGLELIESLARWDLRGEIAYENRVEGGARVVVRFPLSSSAPSRDGAQPAPSDLPVKQVPEGPMVN